MLTPIHSAALWGLLALSRDKLFFFSSRRRHTRLVSDWSSDVCSSDLPCTHRGAHARSCSGGDAGLSPPGGLEPGLGGIGRDRRRGTTTVEGAECNGNEKQWRWQLPAHPHAESGLP